MNDSGNAAAGAEGSLGSEAAASTSYEVIRQRLLEQARELGRRAEALNEQRKQLFGGAEMKLLGSERVRTEHNALPRDIVAVGSHLLLGYSVFMGLKTETRVSDVLQLCRFEPIQDGWDFGAVASGEPAHSFLDDPAFVRDFSELFRFYKHARLVKLTTTETLLLAVFQIGEALSDVRVFRWARQLKGPPRYVDNRGERDYQAPPQHPFEWRRATREDYVAGPFPHVSIEDELFVETTGGTLTIKIENNTQTGEGVWSEPVEDPRQGLDDAVFEHARLGDLILLKVLPYRESVARHYVYAPRTRVIARIDAIGRACLPLPEDQGIVFPGGYCLADGSHKLFPGNYEKFSFERSVRSPNGEDVLFVFYEPESGEYALLAYNLIDKSAENPILCSGYSLFDDGQLVVFREQAEAARVHPVQVWQTPFCSVEHDAARPKQAGALGKIGNADLVRGISDALGVRRSAENTEPTRRVYEDLVVSIGRVLDTYHWLGAAEAFDLRSVLFDLRHTAEQILGEFDKVVALRERTEQAIARAEKEQRELVASLRVDSFKSAGEFMQALGALRRQRGHVISLRELRYADLPRLEKLESEAARELERLSRATLAFLSSPQALAPLVERLNELLAAIERAQKTPELAEPARELEQTSQGITVLSEVVAGLSSDDPTVRTAVLERIAEAFSLANRVRAVLENRRKALASLEGRAEFAIQLQLFRQSVDGALAQITTPEQADEQLSRLTLQLEELEARFSDLTEFAAELHEQREQVNEALGQKKQHLLDERQRRVASVLAAADRILTSLRRRAETFEDEDALNAFYASDPMIEKLRGLAERLVELGDAPKAEELKARRDAAHKAALRLLRDRLELLEQGGDVIRLGRQRFAVNRQPLELTTLLEDGKLVLALAGTDYREVLDDPELEATREFWTQHLVSESDAVYRAEYLAATILFAAERGERGLTIAGLHKAALEPGGLLALVQNEAKQRYDEGYERGLHDADAALILEKLLLVRESAGVLSFPARARSLALLYFAAEGEAREDFRRRARSFARLRELYPAAAGRSELVGEIAAEMARFFEARKLSGDAALAQQAAAYLVEELGARELRFSVQKQALDWVEGLEQELEIRGGRNDFKADLAALQDDLASALELVREWLRAHAAERAHGEEPPQEILEEAAALMLTRGRLSFQATSALTAVRVENLLGDHPRIRERALELRVDEFLPRLRDFAERRVPAYRAYRQVRQRVLDRHRERLRLSELVPKPMATFVRNRLINEVYLPLVGDNLAKQIGAAGDTKRTDLMGLLLIISPPGYGKTTLMEYIAGRLGLVFVKVNGPALGHQVTSLDPAEAPNRTARQEVEKINLALEMGNNVMLYLDDIQHTNPELLQKFISLCDAQRRIEGVWKERSRTYDLRGKRFCIVMAGNPYTESGERFKIPDMLANRADTYNLGDILSGKDDLFALSYIENALTSNPVLAPLAARDPADVYLLVRMAQGEPIPASELSHDYSRVELDEMVGVLRRLFRVQRVLLEVNRAYIQSASTDDRFRTEPPFKLQGSYRNACKLAEKISAAMTDAELDRLIEDHYAGEAQTLTTGAEHNLLKLGLLLGNLSEERRRRWDEIVAAFRRAQLVGGDDEDPVTRVTRQLGALGAELEGIRGTLRAALDRAGRPNGLESHLERLESLIARLGEARFDIHVKNEPPPGVDQLLNHQVSIMERTLIPFVKVATQRLDDSHELRVQLDELIVSLKRIDETLRRQSLQKPVTAE